MTGNTQSLKYRWQRVYHRPRRVWDRRAKIFNPAMRNQSFFSETYLIVPFWFGVGEGGWGVNWCIVYTHLETVHLDSCCISRPALQSLEVGISRWVQAPHPLSSSSSLETWVSRYSSKFTLLKRHMHTSVSCALVYTLTSDKQFATYLND